MVLLLLAVQLCVPVQKAAAAVQSTSHIADKRAPDDQEQTGPPGVLLSEKIFHGE